MTPAGLWSYDREVYFYRLLSIIATAPLALLASAALLAMKCSKRVALIASAFTLLIPEKTFVGSVVNNDGLMIVLAALSVAAGLRYLGGGSRRSAWLAAAAGAGAALTKATGATIAAWAVLVVAIGAYERWNRGDRRDAMAALGGTLVFAAIGSAWYVRNLVEFHNPQPAPAGHPRPLGATKLSFVSFLPSWLDRISQTFWGVPARRLGIALPWWVSHALSVLTVAAVVTAVITGRRLWKYTLPLLAVCLADVLLLLRSDRLANRLHVPGSEYAGVQGRYLFALIVPLAAFVALAVGRLAIRSSRSILGIAIAEIAVGCALHLVLAREMFSRFWAGGGAPFFDHLRAVLAWSPLPVPLTGALLLLPFVLMVALAVSGVRYVRVTQAMSPEETLSIPADRTIASEV
jgi:4-amino-4-deoxy-L-arabinose transferase-like glycosyltransferase